MTRRKTGIASTFRSLLRETSGNALALVGLSLIPLVGTVGLGVDVAQWVVWKRQLHTAADLGALAGARALADGQPVKVNVTRSLAHNKLRNFKTVAIENAPTTGPFMGDADKVRVVLSTSQSLPFSSWFLKATPTIVVEAIAENAKTTPNCIITLDTASTGVNIAGSSYLDMNCGLFSNSDLDADTSDAVNAAALSAVGTVTTGTGVSGDTKINDGQAPVADPYASKIPTPNTQAGCTPNSYPLIQGNWTIDPAIHGTCFQGLQIQKGTTTLKAGTYYIGSSGISIASGAGLTGVGVTIVFTNTDSTFNDKKIGTFSISGGATVKLTAPTTGTYAGIIVYQDPRTPAKNNTLKVTGNSNSYFEGTIYAPTVGVTFTGNSTVDSKGDTIYADTRCMQVVSLTATFTGNTKVTNECPAGSGASAFGGAGTVRLVG